MKCCCPFSSKNNRIRTYKNINKQQHSPSTFVPSHVCFLQSIVYTLSLFLLHPKFEDLKQELRPAIHALFKLLVGIQLEALEHFDRLCHLPFVLVVKADDPSIYL